jgi:RNA polymerase sigma factor (sigma-70 family)
MDDCAKADVIDWLTINFLPHEAELRRMLRRVCGTRAAVDDVIQETCFRLLSLPSLAHVRDPKPFLFRSAKNIMLDGIRRDAVVSMDALTNLEDLDIADAAPSPERVVLARTELQWVIGLVGHLPRRCKHVLRARRLQGLSQHETAQTLGLTASVVEHDLMKATRLISDLAARHGVSSAARE